LWYIACVRLLFVADGRSPTTISWLSYWLSSGDDVHLISTYACNQIPGLASLNIINVAFSEATSPGAYPNGRKLILRLRRPLRVLRSMIGPLCLSEPHKKYLKVVESINPDLIHAHRIPFEGLLSEVTPKQIPLVVSIWGNDITLHAKGSPSMAVATRKVLRRADALFADTHRDIHLGKEWGLRKEAKILVIPGAGGIPMEKLRPVNFSSNLPEELPAEPIIVNPRGQRPGSLRQDIFLQAVKYFTQSETRGIFVCPSLLGDEQYKKLILKLGIQDRVFLWPKLTQAQLWYLFTKSSVYASPSIHDGIPNSMLEAMVLGCFPVTGNIESMKEWIINGENGFLVNANNAKEMANAFIQAINNSALRHSAAKINSELIAERANYIKNMNAVRDVYIKLEESRKGSAY
jgi:glycosyltransferase involved in cell wall biosynthesis